MKVQHVFSTFVLLCVGTLFTGIYTAPQRKRHKRELTEIDIIVNAPQNGTNVGPVEVLVKEVPKATENDVTTTMSSPRVQKNRRNRRRRIRKFRKYCQRKCWSEWTQWSACNESCWGYQTATREMTPPKKCQRYVSKRGCFGSNIKTRPCNRICQNGGTPTLNGCQCRYNVVGQCCEKQLSMNKFPVR